MVELRRILMAVTVATAQDSHPLALSALLLLVIEISPLRAGHQVRRHLDVDFSGRVPVALLDWTRPMTLTLVDQAVVLMPVALGLSYVALAVARARLCILAKVFLTLAPEETLAAPRPSARCPLAPLWRGRALVMSSPLMPLSSGFV